MPRLSWWGMGAYNRTHHFPYSVPPILAMALFADKIGLVMGVANDRSIAWALSQALYAEGAELAFTHLPSPSSERRVRELVDPHQPKIVLPCDIQKDDDSRERSIRSTTCTAGSISSCIRSPSPRHKSCVSRTAR